VGFSFKPILTNPSYCLNGLLTFSILNSGPDSFKYSGAVIFPLKNLNELVKSSLALILLKVLNPDLATSYTSSNLD